MTERIGLYFMVLLGLAFGLDVKNDVKNISKQNREMKRQILERITQQPTLQTANILGDSLPERFYVINGDTVYQEIDGKLVRNYVEGAQDSRSRRR